MTSDATLRVFLPVLDAPQHVQLHASLDVYTALPFSVASQTKSSCVFWLDRGIVSRALAAVLQVPQNGEDDTRHRRVREIKEEGWDLFLRVLSDGSLVVQAVVVSYNTVHIPLVLPETLLFPSRILTGDHRRSSNNLLYYSRHHLAFHHYQTTSTFFPTRLYRAPYCSSPHRPFGYMSFPRYYSLIHK